MVKTITATTYRPRTTSYTNEYSTSTTAITGYTKPNRYHLTNSSNSNIKIKIKQTSSKSKRTSKTKSKSKSKSKSKKRNNCCC